MDEAPNPLCLASERTKNAVLRVTVLEKIETSVNIAALIPQSPLLQGSHREMMMVMMMMMMMMIEVTLFSQKRTPRPLCRVSREFLEAGWLGGQVGQSLFHRPLVPKCQQPNGNV